MEVGQHVKTLGYSHEPGSLGNGGVMGFCHNSKTIRCPYCGHRFGDCTPNGHFNADIKCGRCNLQFIFEAPSVILIYQHSATELLIKRWGMIYGQAHQEIERLIECYTGEHGLVLWDRVKVFAPSHANPERGRRTFT